MLKKQDGFAALKLLLILLVLIAVTGAGYFVYHARRNDSEMTQQDAFSILEKTSDARLASSQKECPYYEQGCLGNTLADGDKLPIAKAYGITTDPKDRIYFGLRKGKSLDIGGIGTGYLNNKSKLDINDSAWYWEIGACNTNNRIFINASTGATTGVHSWAYCSHVDELSAPN